MKPAISRLAAIILADALIAACSGGRAVRVDCDGPLSLINPPASAAAKAGTARDEPPEAARERGPPPSEKAR